jgi:thymidine phosphorylase
MDLAPADRRFYAIRDITATVESIPLITASILSKKIAAGNQGLVMDVKWGTGAFMTRREDADALATSIIATAERAGLPTRALVTDMNETLGLTAGNALEIAESVAYLTGGTREARLDEVVMALSAEMLCLTGLFADRDAARRAADRAVTSGRAAEKFARMTSALGGPSDFLERSDDYLPAAPVVTDVSAEREGFLTAVDARAFGNAIIELGGGRRRVDDTLDLSVGFSDVAPVGAAVGPAGTPLARVHAASEDDARRAIADLRAACRIEDTPPAVSPVVAGRLPAD